MVTAELAAAAVTLVGIIAGIPAWLARRDTHHKQALANEIEGNATRLDELDTAFARVTTRLFGHPDDDSDPGVLTERRERVAEAESNIDSLSDDVQNALAQAEENGRAIETLDARVTEHSQQTREALVRIEEQLENGQVLPDDPENSWLADGGVSPDPSDDDSGGGGESS